MTEIVFRPNWASPPGETIRAVLHAKGLSVHVFRLEIGLDEREVMDLLTGVSPVTPVIAKSLAKSVGSTAHFWLERQKQYRSQIEELAAAEPELASWGATFPVKKMIDSGWLPRPYVKEDAAFELLDYFDIGSVGEWHEKYLSRLHLTKFRTSQTFQNDIPATLAWIRRGELLAEEIECKRWDPAGFRASLQELKALSTIDDPAVFIPALQAKCARHGVAVVVARCIPGCSASGATLMVRKDKALLLLSARFLSDDQFWFSFFHEAGHLVLHGDEPHIEHEGATIPQQETEANRFAEEVILDPAGEAVMLDFRVTPFAIARLARKCGVSPGVIVGQLQHRGKVSPKLFNRFKTRYGAGSFNL